jgi:hypothetical protein
MHRNLRLLGVAVAGTAALASVPLLSTGGAQAARFTGGNLVVYRVGNGAAALTNAAAPVFVDEYSPAGAKLQSIALPTATTQGNSPLTASGLSRSEGQIARSADGRFVTVTGYSAVPGVTGPGGFSLTASDPASVGRVVGVVDANGAADTSTVIKGASAPKIIRSAVSTNGDRFWAAGGNGGVFTTSLGSTSSSVIAGGATSNLNGLTVQGGQLFTSGILTNRIAKIGTGAPTTAAALAPLAGLPDNLLTNGYAFLDLTIQGFSGTGLDTLYIANASERGGTVDKYTFNGSSWQLAGNVDVEGVSGLVADENAGTVTLAVTTPGQLLAITDTHGGNNVFTPASPAVLASAASNEEFRGVALAPSAAEGPSVFVRRPVTASTTSQGSAGVTLSALVTSPNGVASVKAKLGSGALVTAVKGAGDVWTATLPVNKLTAGSTTISVVATDSAVAPHTATVTKSLKISAVTAPSGVAGPKLWSFTNKLVKRKGTWTTFKFKAAPGHKGLTSTKKKSNVTFAVYGRSLVLTFRAQPDAGKAKVSVNGHTYTVDLYAKKKATVSKTYVFTTTGAVSKHTVTIKVLGKKNAKSSGKGVFLADFQVKS